jgi:hypothetical protein
MHPDDEREYMDEISGMTRWDDMRERYHQEIKDMQREGEIDWEMERHYAEQEWNSVSVWAKIKRWVRWQYNRFELWRTKDEIPF